LRRRRRCSAYLLMILPLFHADFRRAAMRRAICRLLPPSAQRHASFVAATRLLPMADALLIAYCFSPLTMPAFHFRRRRHTAIAATVAGWLPPFFIYASCRAYYARLIIFAISRRFCHIIFALRD